MRDLLRGFVELIAPLACARCGRGLACAATLCAACDGALPRLRRSACLRCQEAPGQGPRGLCCACAARPSPLDACLAAAAYGGEVEAWVRRFKYPRPGLSGLDAAPRAVLERLVVEASRLDPGPAPDAIVPIPLHPRRLRQRGFNPALVLSGALARHSGAALAPALLARVRDTPSQTGLDRRERRRNVRDAFQVSRPQGVPRHLWLVDDVVTTGSTLAEAARALRRCGARRVVGICAARTRGAD